MHLESISIPLLVAEAGGDPWVINAALQHGRPGQIDNLASAFHNAGKSASDADTAFEQARKRFEGAWNRETGDHPINDAAQVQLVTGSLGVQAAQLPKIAADLESIAAALAEAQKASAACISELETVLEDIDKHLTRWLQLDRDPTLTAEQRQDVHNNIHELQQAAIDDTGETLRRVKAIRDTYLTALRAAEARLRAEGYDPGLVKNLDQPTSPLGDPLLPIPPAGTDSQAVTNWWNSLTPQQRATYIAQHSEDLGNLPGIPVDVSNEINRAVMTDDLNRVTDVAHARGVSVDDVLADPGKYGMSATAIHRYNIARNTQDGLSTSADVKDERGDHPDVFLWRYRPEAFASGDGAAAIAMGNPDKAANTTVLVKGLGSGVAQGTLSNPDGTRLYHEANAADWDKDTAVVMWVGYDAPDSVFDPGLYQPNMARTGGEALALDVNSLAATHQGAPTHLTVVGHSYGSTTVADAAAGYGMHADDVVLVGSPGTDLAHSAADFHLPEGGHVFVGDSARDEVGWLGHNTIRTPFGGIGLGDDPAMEDFGATRFKAELPDRSLNPVYAHSHYFDNGSESLFSIADVASGHGDALEHDGMLAPHRRDSFLPPVLDPESARDGTVGHYHSTPGG